jgi:hypothetical protein
MTNTVSPAPVVGTPATIQLFTDSVAAVVVKVNAKSVLVRRVAVGEYVQDMARDGAGVDGVPPVMVAEGILDQPHGEPERFSLIGLSREGKPVYRNGSVGLSLGYSRSVRDYRR